MNKAELANRIDSIIERIVMCDTAMKYIFLICILPCGLLGAAFMALWMYPVGGDVLKSSIGAFLGIAIGFVINQILFLIFWD